MLEFAPPFSPTPADETGSKRPPPLLKCRLFRLLVSVRAILGIRVSHFATVTLAALVGQARGARRFGRIEEAHGRDEKSRASRGHTDTWVTYTVQWCAATSASYPEFVGNIA